MSPVGKTFDSFDIRDFGAEPGGFDNFAVFEAAATAINAMGGGRIVVPPGRWHKSGRLTLNVGCTIEGTSWASQIVQESDDIAILFESNNVGESLDGPTLRNIAIDMNGKGQLDAGSIVFNNCEGMLADHVWVRDAGTPGASNPAGVGGISMSAGSLDPSAIKPFGQVRNCLVERTTKAAYSATFESRGPSYVSNVARDIQGNGAAPGFQINGGAHVSLLGNLAERTEGAGFLLGVNGQGTSPDFFMLANNRSIEAGTIGSGSPSGHGFLIANAGFVQSTHQAHGIVQGNMSIGAAQNGFTLQNLSKMSVIGNHAVNAGIHSFAFDGTIGTVEDFLVADNFADGATQAGYFVRNVRRLRLMNNVAIGSHGRGLWFFGSSYDSTVMGNTLGGTVKSVDYGIIPTNLNAALNHLTGPSDMTETVSF